MNIEEAIKVLNNFNPVDCGREDTQAIETLLTAYEKEKEKNKELIKERATEIVYVDKNFVRKDKIKAKIEELDKEEKEVLKGTKGQDRYAIKQEYMHKRSGLQSLLEKDFPTTITKEELEKRWKE